MMALEMQLLLLTFHSTRRIATVADSIGHPIEVQTDAEQYKAKDDAQEQLGIGGGKALHLGRSLVQTQCPRKTLAGIDAFLMLLLVVRVILVRHLFPEDYLLDFHKPIR